MCVKLIKESDKKVKNKDLNWKRFFNVLYKESQRTGKPIVYLIHPTEFLASENYGVPASWFFSPRMWRIQGNPVRYFLFRRDGKVLFEEQKELFAYMKIFKGTRFMTVAEYIKMLSNVD